MFRAAFLKRRCLVPAAAFYEMAGGPRRQDAVRDCPDGRRSAGARGHREGWRSPEGDILRSFAIVTTRANEQMAALHERMPVILEPADWPVWLGESGWRSADAAEAVGRGRAARLAR